MKLLSFQFIFISIISVKGFTPQPFKTTNLSKLANSNDDGGWNPFNDAKKNLVKFLAGDYDSPTVRAKLLSLIDDEPVLMLSFVK